MKIADGGATENIRSDKIKELRISAIQEYKFEFWVNDCLSYMTLQEVIELRDELEKAIIKSVAVSQKDL